MHKHFQNGLVTHVPFPNIHLNFCFICFPPFSLTNQILWFFSSLSFLVFTSNTQIQCFQIHLGSFFGFAKQCTYKQSVVNLN